MRKGLIGSAVLLLVLSRLVPHSPNFTPILSAGLFAGALLGRHRFLSYLLPLSAMVLSDFLLGFHNTMLFVYAGVGWSVLVGQLFLQKPTIALQLVSAFMASVGFFIISNYGVWFSSNLYPHDGSGLIQCYVMALPFLANTLLSTGLYLVASFGLLALFEKYLPSVRAQSY